MYPELVTLTATGEVQAVRCQELIPLLLNEVQRQQQVMERQPQATERRQREPAELRSLVGQMRGGSRRDSEGRGRHLLVGRRPRARDPLPPPSRGRREAGI